MAQVLKDAGILTKFTRYPDVDHGHEVMRRTYTNPIYIDGLKAKKNL